MELTIEMVCKENYQMFDDMIFHRRFERYKSEDEANEQVDYSEQYAIIDKQLLNTYAVRIGDRFVGYISTAYIPKIGLPSNNGFLYVDDLWVNPHYRRAGVGEILLKKAEDLAHEKSIYGLRLYVSAANDPAIALYKKCGYTYKYDEARLMEKVL
jgi:ribosomal protein S18 acetylase RimI-like enzyme